MKDNLLYAAGAKDLNGFRVVPFIISITEGLVSADGIVSLFLQLVGSYLIAQADAATLLPEVDD